MTSSIPEDGVRAGQKRTAVGSATWEPARRLLCLAQALGETKNGLTIEELRDATGTDQVDRRTVYRMLRTIRFLFGEERLASEMEPDGRTKRWRLLGSPVEQRVAAALEAADLDALRLAADALDDRPGTVDAARRVRKVLGRLATAHRLDQFDTGSNHRPLTTVLAHSPGFWEPPDRFLTDMLRRAISARQVLNVEYRASGQDRAKHYTLEPLGLVEEHRTYLIGRVRGLDPSADPRHFRLSRIVSAVLTGEVFAVPSDFNLAEHVKFCFGVFRAPGPPPLVVLRFDSRVADDALSYRWHPPTQRSERLADGRVEVVFEAHGLVEIGWAVFQFGNTVEVLEPLALRQMLLRMLRDAVKHHEGHERSPEDNVHDAQGPRLEDAALEVPK